VNDICVDQASSVGDLGASYGFDASGHAVLLRAYVQNLTDTKYWVPGAAGTSISAGAPRTFTVSAQVALQGDRNAAAASAPGGTEDGRVGHAYLELDAGGAIPQSFSAAVNNRVDNTSSAPGAIQIAQKAGWDVDGVLGYNFGRFSAEVETGFKRYKNGAINFANANVAIDQAGEPAGQYANGGGRTGVLSVLFNGLINLGNPDGATRGFVGGGLGLARVSTGQWTLDRTQAALQFAAPYPATSGANGTPSYFSDDNATAFAWQGLAGVRQALSDRVDLVVKYRYFQVPGLTLRTTNGNQLKGNLFGSSVLAGIAWKL
jgi:iron complex outermembrane receptor protein